MKHSYVFRFLNKIYYVNMWLSIEKAKHFFFEIQITKSNISQIFGGRMIFLISLRVIERQKHKSSNKILNFKRFQFLVYWFLRIYQKKNVSNTYFKTIRNHQNHIKTCKTNSGRHSIHKIQNSHVETIYYM